MWNVNLMSNESTVNVSFLCYRVGSSPVISSACLSSWDGLNSEIAEEIKYLEKT